MQPSLKLGHADCWQHNSKTHRTLYRRVGKGGSEGAVAPLDLEAVHCFSIV